MFIVIIMVLQTAILWHFSFTTSFSCSVPRIIAHCQLQYDYVIAYVRSILTQDIFAMWDLLWIIMPVSMWVTELRDLVAMVRTMGMDRVGKKNTWLII